MMNVTDKFFYVPTENVGYIDRTVRIIVAIYLSFIVVSGLLINPENIFLLSVITTYLTITAIISFDPLYLPFQLTSKQEVPALNMS